MSDLTFDQWLAPRRLEQRVEFMRDFIGVPSEEDFLRWARAKYDVEQPAALSASEGRT